MIVASEQVASRFKGPTLPPVLATPSMIPFMENAAPDVIREYPTPGAATPVAAVSRRPSTVVELSARWHDR